MNTKKCSVIGCENDPVETLEIIVYITKGIKNPRAVEINLCMNHRNLTRSQLQWMFDTSQLRVKI